MRHPYILIRLLVVRLSILIEWFYVSYLLSAAFKKSKWLYQLSNDLTFIFFSYICMQWITQCFWNYLDWIEICHYIATCVFLGPDYQVYICIAIFKHLQQDILQHTQTQDLQVFLKVSNFISRGKILVESCQL